MKILKTIVAAVLLVSVSSFAGMDLMVGGGLNISNFKYSQDLDTSVSKTVYIGFNLGANLFIPFSEQFGITPGVNFETRGTNIEIKSMKFKMTWSMKYLEVPILLTFKPIPELALKVGPEVGLYVGGKGKIEQNFVTAEGDIASETVNTIDFGLSLGASYTIANTIAIGAAYYMGFSTVDKSTTTDAGASTGSTSGSATSGSSGDFKNNNIKIYAAYVIHL